MGFVEKLFGISSKNETPQRNIKTDLPGVRPLTENEENLVELKKLSKEASENAEWDEKLRKANEEADSIDIDVSDLNMAEGSGPKERPTDSKGRN